MTARKKRNLQPFIWGKKRNSKMQWFMGSGYIVNCVARLSYYSRINKRSQGSPSNGQRRSIPLYHSGLSYWPLPRSLCIVSSKKISWKCMFKGPLTRWISARFAIYKIKKLVRFRLKSWHNAHSYTSEIQKNALQKNISLWKIGQLSRHITLTIN